MPLGLNAAARQFVDRVGRPGDAWLGRVSRVDRGAVRVLDQAAREHIVIRSINQDPLVGDWVWLSSGSGNTPSMQLCPRYSQLFRTRADGTTQHLCSNIDMAFLVVTAREARRPGLLERLAATGWESGATPHFVITKLDEIDFSDRAATENSIKQTAPGIELTMTSSASGEGVDQLRAVLGGEVSAVLVGHSGVGKSSLTNQLVGAETLATADVRPKDGKGRHVTTARSIIQLPGSNSIIIDTPGIRELGMSAHAPLEDVFVEIDELASRCRFGDCSHTNDAGCAVANAVDEDIVSPERYQRYLALLKERHHREQRNRPTRREKTSEYSRLAREFRQIRGH